MRTVWLHWIGNCYYSISQFIQEAKKMGVSRRISLRTLKKMEWGDKIYLLSREKGIKKPAIFGFFYLIQVEGIELKDLPEKLKVSINVVKASSEVRGCGTRVHGGIYLMTSASVNQLSEYIPESSNPMIYGALNLLPKPWPILKNLVSFRGFRKFNETAFLEELSLRLEGCKDGRRPVLEGVFYV
jgi:hypothetical protein